MLIHWIFCVVEFFEVNVFVAADIIFYHFEFGFESAGEYEQAHDFYYADTFFLNIVQFLFRMEYAVRMSLVGAVVT